VCAIAEWCLVTVQVGPLQYGVQGNVRLEKQHFCIKFCSKLEEKMLQELKKVQKVAFG
jgi:hypothetical protein